MFSTRSLSFATVIACAAAAALVPACQPASDPALNAKLDTLEKKLDSLEAKINRLAAAGVAAPGRQRPAEAGPREPDPKLVYAVPVNGEDPVKGPATAKVTIVEAAEFACPFCRVAEDTMAALAEQYGDQVRFVYKHYVVHPDTATIPALASCAAQKQGKFWEMKSAIFNSVWELQNGRPRMKDRTLLGQDNMEKLAADMGLDLAKFKADMAAADCKQLIDRQQRTMGQVGVNGTPAFYINGRPLSGAQPIDVFKKVIDEEIKKFDDAVKAGANPAQYYDTVVVAKGKKSV